ncbi:unnamed protein product [Rhizoctonia solani]|uniref:CHAT domain-containing protein n=1 Tax=Rhizoctonia solani TaxID=456999 RepID=A0A8H3CGS3_9AGAM|nr:unnamed protein product [Rhizoctonia solani]
MTTSGANRSPLDTFLNMSQLEVIQGENETSGIPLSQFWAVTGYSYLEHSQSGIRGARLYLDSVTEHLARKLDSLLETVENADVYSVKKLEKDIVLIHVMRIVSLATANFINELIEWGARVMSSQPSYSFDMIRAVLRAMGDSFISWLQEGGTNSDMHMAVECYTHAIQLTPESHDTMPVLLSGLGKSYAWRILREDSLAESIRADFTQAVKCFRAAVLLTPPRHRDFSRRLTNLEQIIQAQKGNRNRVEDIDFAIECASQVIGTLPEEHPQLPKWFLMLGTIYVEKCFCVFNLEDADLAIWCIKRALCFQPDNPEELFKMYTDLGDVHKQRSILVSSHDIQDVDATIKNYCAALAVLRERLPMNNEDAGGLLSRIGAAYWERFTRLGDENDLNDAMEYYYQALSLALEGHLVHGMNLTDIGQVFLGRYQYAGNLEDLTTALNLLHQALLIIPEEPAVLLALGAVYQQKFDVVGGLDNIDQAVSYSGRALSLSPNTSLTIVALNNLGDSHRRRYQRLNDPKDIEKATDYLTSSLAHIEASNDLKLVPAGLNNLALVHIIKFEIRREYSDIDKAIQYLNRALLFDTRNPASRSMKLMNLGFAQMVRSDDLEEDDDMNEGIRAYTEALTCTPAESPLRPMMLASLGSARWDRFKKHSNYEDIQAAVSLMLQAISLLPSEHPDMSKMLNTLGKIYQIQAEYLGNAKSLNDSSDSFRKAAQHSAGRPFDRFDAATRWARVASYSHSEQLEAYQTAMDLVPRLIWLGTSISQRYSQEIIQTVGKVTLGSASVAIGLNEYEKALEWLEQGRAVVWGQILQLRTPLEELAVVDPTLAEHLTNIARELHNFQALDTSVSQTLLAGSGKSLEMAAQRHRYLAMQYEETVGKVHQIPGFESFLQPKRAAELMHAPQRGPLVVVNVHELRCDALILIPGKQQISHVSLPSFSSQKAASCRARMESSHLNIRDRGVKIIDPFDEGKGRGVQQVLLELWEDVVKPVLDCLGYTLQAPIANADKLPHITWCTTGALSFLPLHAAGCYNPPGARIYDYVISSYTPTLSALIPKSTMLAKQTPRLLLVGQEHTPGHNPLPGTRKELAHIRSCADAQLSYTQLDGNNATTDAVLNAMEEHEWVHLACHAHQDSRSPLDSGFFLQDGTLSLLQISQKEFKNKGLAFLSACQTAKGDKVLPEEAVHLASGMIMAGYPAVIATMWSVEDTDAPVVSDAVYGGLIEKGQADYRNAAKALHVAVGKLREMVGVEAFVRWVPYIHIGG